MLDLFSRDLPLDVPLSINDIEDFDPDFIFGGPEVSGRLKKHEVKEDIIYARPSEWVEFAFQIFDKEQHKLVPFPFTNRDYLKEVYDNSAKDFVLLFSRQSEKSTTLGNLAITHACLVPFLHILYVSPSANQTKIFSKDRVKEPVESSARLRSFISKGLTQNVFEKTFLNLATIILRYAFYSADRSRGIAADILLLDELQDMLVDNIPVLEETLSHSVVKKRYYSGTPKVRENTLGAYWGLSTQNEWLIPCDCKAPNRYWNILDGRNIGKDGLICKRCGKAINPYHEDAQWASATRKFPDGTPREFEGYRVPQIMVPIHQGPAWADILRKRNEYPPAQFDNEVLALFSESGERPITRDELIACCDPRIDPRDEDYLKNILSMCRGGGVPIYAGIDYGMGAMSQGHTGYTVLALGSYLGTADFKIFYIRRFDGEDSEPRRQMDLILTTLREFNVRIAGADHGFGFMQNAELQEAMAHRRGIVAKFQYATRPGKKISYNSNIGCFTLHRSQIMANVFNILKRASREPVRPVSLPCWDFFERPYGMDILSIFSEYNESLRMIQYNHPIDRPDDSFHAIVYCLLASALERPRKDLFGLVDFRTGV